MGREYCHRPPGIAGWPRYDEREGDVYGHSPNVLPGRYPPGYGVAPAPPPAAHGWGVPQGYPAYPPPRLVEEKVPGLAAVLEVIGGACFQTFGVGHLYAGNVGVGLAWMLGYWAVCFVNFILMFLLIGFITWPLCWIAAMIIAPMTAANAAKRANERAAHGYF